MKVSILMPCYNVEKFVAEAIESIIKQTFSDFELIVLDDCSTDKTAEIVKKNTDKRIVYHCNEQNLGLVGNLNAGLSLAKGEYIARMDGDDISLPQRLETQVNYLNAHSEIGLCSTAMQLFGNKNEVWIRASNPKEVKIAMLFFSPILHASSMWRKQIFEDNNLVYRKNSFPAEDYDLWARAIFHCEMVNLPDILYRYRIHGLQVTTSNLHFADKTAQVQKEFLQKTLPALSANDNDFFVRFLHFPQEKIADFEKFVILMNKMLVANATNRFFDDKLLAKYLRAQLECRITGFVRQNKKLKPLRYLSLKGLVKFILNR